MEFVTAASGDPSTATEFGFPTNKDTLTNEKLTAATANEPQSVMSTTEDAVSYAAAEAVNRDVELIVPLSSSSATDAREPQNGCGLGRIDSTLQGFKTLRLEMLSQLETTDGVNKDEHPTAAEKDVIIRRLLESLECGIKEIQANTNTVNIYTPVQYNI